MNILILSFYFKPDLSAGSFRTASLLTALKKHILLNAKIHIITSMPNRYHSHCVPAAQSEIEGNIEITRVPLPPHKSGMLSQARAFLSYFIAVHRLVRKKKYDIVFATSSRLLTAFLGATVARRKKAPLYLDIRDIFLDTMDSIFPGRGMKSVLYIFSIIEKFTLSTASRINLVSPGFLPYFKKIFPTKHFDVYTNGIDIEFLEPRPQKTVPKDKKIILYTGNIGEGQGLEKIIPELAIACKNEYHFIIIGDGGRRQKLEEALLKQQVTNVELKNPIARNELMHFYDNADVLFLHLNDYPAFLKVLPSKLFEYAALGKPILAGVNGYSRLFIESEVPNATVFPPCDAQKAMIALAQLKPGFKVRSPFIKKYNRASIMDQLALSILAIAQKNKY